MPHLEEDHGPDQQGDDRIKIGTSGNPRGRLGQIWHDELLAFERGGALVNQTLASKRRKGASGLPLTRADLYR